MQLDIRYSLHNRPMSLFQIIAITICVLISLIDGFDVLAVAFVGPSIATYWQLTPAQLGLLFSAGLAGMVIGALFISPFADKLGRRFIVLSCLIILSIGMFASGLAANHQQLIAARIFTGLGMGAILPAINTVVAEYSSAKYRSLAISIMAAGYTVGAMIGGMIAIYLINHWGWRYVFLFGGTFSVLLIPVVIFQLPESLDFLLNRARHNRLQKLNGLLTKLRLPLLQSISHESADNATTVIKRDHHPLLTSSMLKATILLCSSYFMLMCSFYFLANWTPKILVSFGYSQDTSITASIIMNLFGIAGGLGLGWLSKKYSVQKVTALMLFISFILLVSFGLSINNIVILMTLIALIGFVLFGAMAGLYATAPVIFPAEIRATGTGMVLGIGRLGATLGPYLAGILIAAGWSKEAYFSLLALPLLIATIGIWLLRNTRNA